MTLVKWWAGPGRADGSGRGQTSEVKGSRVPDKGTDGGRMMGSGSEPKGKERVFEFTSQVECHRRIFFFG